MKNIDRQLAWLAGFLVVVLLSACKNAADPADATSQDAEMTAAEVEALWLDLPGNDTEFNRLLVEELRTGVPMDRDAALRALEADGRRFRRFAVVNEDDLTPEQIAEADAAEAESLAIMEEWLRLPGNDREFYRLVAEELRTGIPMDWDDALHALEADGWRIPDRARRTSGQDPMGVASAGGRDVYCSIVHEPTYYYGGAQWYREAVHALSFCKGQQRMTCHSVRHESTRIAWNDDDGREHVSPHEYWVARGCSVEDSEQVG